MSSSSTSQLASIQLSDSIVLGKMLSKFGIGPVSCSHLYGAMDQTNSFFAGGAITALAQAVVDGATEIDLKDGSDLDLWVPVFAIPTGSVSRKPDGFEEYNNLAMRLIDSALKMIGFAKVPRSAAERRSDYYHTDFDSYKIASVTDYRHLVTARTVQVIAVAHKSVGRLPTALDIIRAFDISICRFIMKVKQLNDTRRIFSEEIFFETDALYDSLRRRVFTLNPSLRNIAKTAERIAKYYERGYHMEASVTCLSCKHAESRALTLDEALGYVLAGESKPVPKNTVETVVTAIVSKTLKEAIEEAKVAQTPPRKPAAEPVCPPAPERVKPRLTVCEAGATGGGSAIPTPPEIAPASLPYARYYKDLTPLLGEQLINVNVEANGHLQTFRLYESVLRRAMTALGSKGAGKHLVFWRGAARFADYVSDEVLEMIKEMSRSSQTTY
jgi:hypothetical protein